MVVDPSFQAGFPVRAGGCGGLLTSLGLRIFSSIGENPGSSRILEVLIDINWKVLLIVWDLLAIARTSLTIR